MSQEIRWTAGSIVEMIVADAGNSGGEGILFEKFFLSNGLTTLLRSEASAQISLCLAVPAGARTDPEGKSGLAHLLEHCYALGSRSLGVREFDLRIERAGGTCGALTTPDATLHFTALPVAGLPSLLEAEADRFATLSLPEREVCYERDVVVHEGTERIGRAPAGALVHHLLGLAFSRHPYRNPVVGWPHEVRALSVEDLRAFYSAHYVPANAVLAVTGGFDLDEVRRCIENSFGVIPAAAPPRVDVPDEPRQTAARSDDVTHPKAEGAHVTMLWKVPPLDHDDTPTLLIAERLLQRAIPGGRFQHWLLRDEGALTFHARTADAAAGEGSAWAAVSAVAAGDISERSLGAARREVADRLPPTARTLARFAATSNRGADWLVGLSSRLSAVGAADVAAATARYLRPERVTVVRMSPG